MGPGTGTPTPATVTSFAAIIEFSTKFTRDWLQVHEVAKTASKAFPHFILPTARLPEIRNGRQLRVNGPTAKPSAIKHFYRLLCIFFTTKLNINIAYKVIAKVVTNIHFFDFAIFFLALDEHFLEKLVKQLLCLNLCHIRHRILEKFKKDKSLPVGPNYVELYKDSGGVLSG
uniref:Uncharacterized protein n=1 Tax=Schistocephalus solidus TaxID=70667 RepID=A0A0X3Q257_SCHSO